MARRNQESEFERPVRRRRKWRKRTVGGLLCLAILLLIVLLPSLFVRRAVVVPLINRYAGLAPLQVRLENIQAGWFAPAAVQGLELADAEGRVLLRAGQIETTKGLLGWLGQPMQLGTIRIRQLETAVVAQSGTTNLEQALQPLMDQWLDSQDDPEIPTESSRASGTIEVLDSKLLLTEAGRPEKWLVEIPVLTIALPDATQVLGPIEIKAEVGDISGTVQESRGMIAANVRQSEDSPTVEIRAKLDNVPVDVWHWVHARCPDLPVQELQGHVSATLAGTIVDGTRWAFDVTQMEGRGLRISSTELLGEHPARLELISAAGRAALADAVLRVDGAQLNCDFAAATASAQIPWPLVLPTATYPFLAGAVVDARGSIDLPRLARAAESLLPLREDTQLLAGTAQFMFMQQLDAAGSPDSRVHLELAGLQAVAAGQPLTWNDPLTVDLSATHGSRGLQMAASAVAEFCNLNGQGTIEAGQLSGNVDLDLLQQRLSQYVELPISNMTGSAQIAAAWQMGSDQMVEAKGNLTTTPLIIAANGGGQIQEPAWTGEFSAAMQMANGAPQHLARAQLTFQSQSEQMTVDLREPLALATASPGEPSANPAAFSVNLVGDLSNWLRRGTMWLAEPPELELAGNLSLALGGRIDLQHVEILEANWRSQPLQVAMPQIRFAEPQMVGNFKGRVDTSDLTRLVVEKLEVQATSFSLGARDAAAEDGNGSRVGQAMFLVDLDRLLKSMSGAASGGSIQAATATNAATQYTASGRVQGQLAWQVDAGAAAVEINGNGQDLVLRSQSPGALAATPLWSEPQWSGAVKGKWVAETGEVTVESLQMQLPWMNCAGKLVYGTQADQPAVRIQGQAVYDSVQLTQKLIPLIGTQVQLYGQQTVPFDITWTGSSDANRSSLAGLDAVTRIGWEQARVAGIAVGQADVPVTITAGQLATAAEFPVSGGKLRWDVTSDLTADELVIVQKPMTVLENVAITEQMCQDWLKYVTPLLAEATSVDGRLSLRLDQARLNPSNPKRQTIAGQVVIHQATVGPGPLSNQVISLVKQIDAIRRKDFAQAVSTQKVWLNMPEQRVDFQMVDGRVVHQNLNVKVGDATISTAGSVDLDGRLAIQATLPIPDDWIDKSPLLAGMRGQALQFPVGGTLSQPQVDTQLLQQFGRQTVQSAASGLLQQQLSRGLEKLFGSPPTPAASPSTGQ